jgi:hypothetical protein
MKRVCNEELGRVLNVDDDQLDYWLEQGYTEVGVKPAPIKKSAAKKKA